MRLYRDRAVVLRQHKLGEADRIVTLLTRDHGLVRAVAKGVRRTRSRFGARLEPFAHIDVQLHTGRNLDIVTQVQSIDAFASDIVSDYGRYTCACAMLETAERLAGEERAPVPALHRLTVAALRAVADGAREPLSGLLSEGVAGTLAIPGKHGGPLRPTASVYVAVPDHPGELARLFADAGDIGVNIEDVHIDHDPGRPVGLVELVVEEARAEHLLASLESRDWVTHR